MAADFSGMDLAIFADMMTAARCGIDLFTDRAVETKLSAPKTFLGACNGLVPFPVPFTVANATNNPEKLG